MCARGVRWRPIPSIPARLDLARARRLRELLRVLDGFDTHVQRFCRSALNPAPYVGENVETRSP